MVGGTSDVANALTFTSTDLAAIAQGGANNGFGLITLGSATGANAMSLGGMLSFSTNLALEALGGLTLQIPSTPYPAPDAVELIVTGTLNLESSPLHLTAPGTKADNGALITLIHTTGGMAGSIFLGLPQGATVADSAGHHYTLSYKGEYGNGRCADGENVAPAARFRQG